MSSNEIVVNQGKQVFVNTDTSKLFLGENHYDSATYTNSSYDEVTLVAGTLMGRIATPGGANSHVVPLESGATNGSQYPVGILADDYVVAAGDSISVAYCVEGEVASELVILQGSDTLPTVISGRTIKDRIAADTVGIKLVVSDELTGYDNS